MACPFLFFAMENDFSVIRQHLRQILTEAPEGRMPLSRLGARLREVLPGFSAEAYGFPTLKALLQHATTPGKLVQTGPLEWWLVADSAAPPGPEAPTDQERASSPRRVRIEPSWWRAVTEFDEARHAWFDLQEEQLSTNAELAMAEPERFLAVPRFGVQAQRELARAWSDEQSSPMRENFLAALAEPKLTSFVRAVQQAGLSSKWNERRLELISSALFQWAKDHGIEPQTFSHVSHAPRSERSPAGAPLPRSSGMSFNELRQFLHHVVEDMTESELMQVPVPARFLLRR